MSTKGLGHRENDLSVGGLHSVALDIIEETVRIRLLVGIYTVKIHHLEYRFIGNIPHRKIIYLCAGRVAEIFNIELKILLLKLVGTEGIDVFHHQFPHRQVRRNSRASKHLQIKCLRRIGDVAGEFTHLIHFPLIGVFISHTEHLISVEGGFKRNVTESGIEGIFA